MQRGKGFLVRVTAASLKGQRRMRGQAVCQQLANVVSQRPASTAVWWPGDGAGHMGASSSKPADPCWV